MKKITIELGNVPHAGHYSGLVSIGECKHCLAFSVDKDEIYETEIVSLVGYDADDPRSLRHSHICEGSPQDFRNAIRRKVAAHMRKGYGAHAIKFVQFRGVFQMNETTKEKGDINQEVFDKACRIAHAAPAHCDVWQVYGDLLKKRGYGNWMDGYAEPGVDRPGVEHGS